jgi:hypothetical protein
MWINRLAAINHGIQMWIGTQTDPQLQVHALTAGSLKGPDVLLTAAFTEQLKSIGWYHFLMGRLCRWWGPAVALYNKQPNATSYQTSWTAQTVNSYGSTPAPNGLITIQWYMEPLTRKWSTKSRGKL